MKKFRFPILLKVILAGLLVSFVASITAIIVSYNNQVSAAKKALAASIDNALDDVSYYCELDEESSTTLENLAEIKTHIRDGYKSRVENGTEKTREDFETFEEYETYYKDADHWVFPRSGEIGLSREMLEFRVKYKELLASLIDAKLSSGSVAAYVAYLDNNETDTEDDDKLVFIADSRMSKRSLDSEPFYHLPGSYYKIKSSDRVSDDQSVGNHSKLIISNCSTRYYTIYSQVSHEEIARFFIEYDEKAALAEVNGFLRTEILVLGLTSGAIILIYALLSYFMFVKNVNKLSKASTEISEKLADKELTTPTPIKVRSHDEMSNLALSMNALQQAVYDYANIIEKEAKEREKINAELEVASRIQLEALPSFDYDDANISLRAYIKAAKEVGGDFYDYFYLDESRFAVVIADVSGKGVPASLFMMKSKTILKGDILSFKNLEEAIYNSNNRLVSNNKENLFVTAFIGIIDLKKKEMTFVNAGHEKPYILSNGKIRKLDGNSNFVIGEVEDFKYKQEIVKFDEGDKIIMFTDGLNESINKDNEEFGYERIVNNLERNIDEPLDNIIKSINKDLSSFVGHKAAFDDVTIIALSLNKPTLNLKYKDKDYSVITKAVDEFENKFSYLPTKVKSEVGIIIDELVNNLVSYEKKEDLIIRFEFAVNKDRLTIKIICNGDDYNPFKNHKKNYLTHENEGKQIGGFGVQLVKELVNEYSYEFKNNNSIITLIKKV